MEKLKQAACQAIDNASEELHRLSQEIWENPELNFEEHHAHKVITDFLDSKDFTVQKHYKLETAFKGELGSPDKGPNIAVLCEYDALPEIGHACGHNLIAESGIAAAIGIQAAFKEAETPIGKLTVLGTPAEEGGGGKLDLINAGAFDDIDIAMMVHPAANSDVNASMIGIDRVKVTYSGKAAHAEASPWNGINALDAAVLCYQTVSCMRQQMKPKWRVHGIIKNGGIKSSIIPDCSELEFCFRAPSNSELNKLRDKMKACFEAAAVGTGCQVVYKFSDKPYMNLVTNKRLADIFKTNASALGVDFKTSDEELCASSDIGNVSHMLPTIHPLFAIGSTAVNHTKDFTSAAGDPKAQPFTLTQGKAMAMTCIDVFNSSQLLQEIKSEFQELV